MRRKGYYQSMRSGHKLIGEKEKITSFFIIKNISAILFTFAAIVYIYGFIYLKYYLNEFGAGWILNDFNPFTSFNINWILAPSIYVFIIIILPKLEEKTQPFPYLFIIITLAIYFVTKLTLVIVTYNNPELIYRLYKIENLLHGLFAFLFVMYLIPMMQSGKFKFTYTNILLILIIIQHMFLIIPKNSALSNVEKDINLDKSTLPIVKIKDEEYSIRNRLLIVMNNNYYVVRLVPGEKKPNIRIISKDGIEYISPK